MVLSLLSKEKIDNMVFFHVSAFLSQLHCAGGSL